MNPKHLIWSLTAAALLTPASIGVVRSEGSQHASHNASNNASTLPDAVRKATERFQDVRQAIAAGYAQSGGCVSGQEEGAMGVHYVNGTLFDGRLEVEKPEALVYEPKRNGQLELVAVEYITPADAWLASHPLGVQPDLMGHLFHFTPGPNRYGPAAFYELHVWAWKNNPRGTFADWNPNVSCADWAGTSF
jgi:hypothetical protein